MGATPSAEPAPQANQGLLIDENGNICRPPQNPRPPAGGVQLQNATGGRFQSLSDRPSTSEVPSTRQGLQAAFPQFNIRSMVGYLCITQVVVYMASCWVVSPRGLFTPNFLANWKIGSSDLAMDQCAVQVGGKFIFELRRFITPIFLHMNIIHLVGNLSVQVSLGPRMLAVYGAELYTALFLVSGSFGNMLSDAFAVGGLGASTATMGLAGALLAQVWLAWGSLDAAWKETIRNVLIVVAVAALVFELFMWNVVNHYGHFGGLVGGFALAVVLTREAPLPVTPFSVPSLPPDIEKRRYGCGIFMAIFVLGCFLKIFVLNPLPQAPVPQPSVNGTIVDTGMKTFCEQKWMAYSQ